MPLKSPGQYKLPFIEVMSMLGAMGLAPCIAIAQDIEGSDPTASGINEQYLSQMKTMYGINATALNSLDWLFAIAGVVLSVFCVVFLFYWIFKLIFRLFAIQAGKKQLKDMDFWKRMGVGLFIWLIFLCGAIYSILESTWVYMKLLGGFK
ncbi:hypothetical protein [Paenibacillus mesotrionivorans]|jgi:hypothetical protein|uniref:Uncharacterized protein n=1 Tax=Paenibacillus mesotrionivorans TaxID=3160968 RepID=A0ACC7NWD2_9BACL